MPGFLRTCLTLFLVFLVPNSSGSLLSTPVYKFAVELLKVLQADNDGNLIFSPVSISSALSLLQQGAEGKSAIELEKILHVKRDQAPDAYKQALFSLKSRQTKSLLRYGNKIFVKSNTSLQDNFERSVTENFDSTIECVDFVKNYETANKINSWVYNITDGRIRNLVDAESLTADSALLLVNAIYFKGLWENPFPKDWTNTGMFRTKSGEKIPVKYMNIYSTEFSAGRSDKLKSIWVELPFEGKDYSLYAILPDENSSIEELSNNLTPEDIQLIVSNNRIRTVTLTFPRFQIGLKKSLVEPLKKLGLNQIFSNDASLTRLIKSLEPLQVTDVVHNANLEINEEGGTASAATSVHIHTLSLNSNEMFISFNRPFLVLLVDKINNLPLFIGQLNEPTQA